MRLKQNKILTFIYNYIELSSMEYINFKKMFFNISKFIHKFSF